MYEKESNGKTYIGLNYKSKNMFEASVAGREKNKERSKHYSRLKRDINSAGVFLDRAAKNLVMGTIRKNKRDYKRNKDKSIFTPLDF